MKTLCKIAAIGVITLAVGSVNADIIARYTFDVDNSGTTPCAVSSNTATLGSRVQINTTPGLAKVGTGVLEMMGPGDPAVATRPIPGAATNNDFSFGTGARTITFWWRALSPNVDTGQGTYISIGGSETVPGARLDIRENGSGTSLRVEIQGAGSNSNPAIDDGQWHFVAVVVPQGAQLKDVAWYVDGSATNLNTSTSTAALNTASSPLVMGASILTAQSARTPYGYLDDVQLYNEALTLAQIQSLYNNPGSMIGGVPVPSVDAGNDWISWSSEPVTTNATIVNNTSDPVLPLTYAWTVDADSWADANLAIVRTNADQENATVQVTKLDPTGDATVVTMTLVATNIGSENPGIDTMTIDVYDDACKAALSVGAGSQTDLSGNCVTHLEDLAILLSAWLDDYSLAEPFVL